MAEDRGTLFFPRVSTPEPDLDLPSDVRHDNNPLNSRSNLNLDEENTQQLILHPEEAVKRKRNENILLWENIRRKKMRHFFSTLHSLLPFSTTRKVARHCIIEETGKYIQNLQSKAQELQKEKAQLLATRSSLMDHNSSAIDRESMSLDVGMEVYGSETVIIRITASRMPRSLFKIYEVVEAVGLDIQRADVYKGVSTVFLYFHATVIVNTGPHYLLRMSQTSPCLKATLQNIY